ncbi:MAG TPA: hypothetical protein VF754_10615 [Pyrinomonadaceae bacterium]
MNEQTYRERECVHRRRGVAGKFYRGETYVQSLQRLRSAAKAMKISGNVTAFFWSDAKEVVVWLCRDCATDLNLPDATA